MNNYYNWLELMKKSDLSSTSKLVAYCIGSYMNSSTNIAWPSQKKIAEDTSLSVRTVVNSINNLVACGWFKVSKNNSKSSSNGGLQYNNSYTSSIPDKVVQEIHYFTKGGESDDKGGAGAALEGVQELHTNNNVNNNIITKEKTIKKSKRFTPPSIDEVKKYCNERGNSIDPESFIDFYNSSGWMRGKTKIKCWKSCIRTWERNNEKHNKNCSAYEDDYAV